MIPHIAYTSERIVPLQRWRFLTEGGTEFSEYHYHRFTIITIIMAGVNKM